MSGRPQRHSRKPSHGALFMGANDFLELEHSPPPIMTKPGNNNHPSSPPKCCVPANVPLPPPSSPPVQHNKPDNQHGKDA